MSVRNKRFMILTITTLVCIGTLFFTGCRKKASEEIGFGVVEGSLYTNKFFGFAIKFPDDWSVQDNEAQKQIMEMGSEVISGDDKNMKAMIKASKLQTVNLFMVSEHPKGAPVNFNPSIVAVAERVGHTPGIKRGKDHLFHVRKFLESSQLDVSFLEEIYTEEIDGCSFDIMSVEMDFGGVIVKQKYYSTVLKGYAFGLILAYSTPEQETALKSILETISFKNE